MTDHVFSLKLEDIPAPEAVEVIHQGMDAHNAFYGCSPLTTLGAFLRGPDGTIMGGAFGDLGWGWLYVDLVWLDAALRRTGQGARVLASLEQGALARGISNIYLATTSFQALPFYYHQGYRLFGMMENRPPGYNYYYVKRTITPAAGDWLPCVDDPPRADFDALRQGLRLHAVSRGVKVDAARLVILLRDAANTVCGGLLAATYWGWLDLHTLWVAPELRGQGYGAAMLRLAEGEAVRRGCPFAVVDAAAFQSVAFFQRQGYLTFAFLEDRPPGFRTHFMRKHLASAH